MKSNNILWKWTFGFVTVAPEVTERKMTKKLLLFIWGIFSFAFLSCSSGGRNKGDLNIYSVNQDAKIGAYWSNYVHKEMPMLFDDRLTTFVDAIGQKIVAKFSEDRLFDYQFKIIKDPQVNAFALPGGYIFINLGLLQAVEEEAQLASVLGHEMGHVVYRHGTEQLTKAQGWTCCLSLAAATSGLGSTQIDIINLFGQTGLLYYGRGAELEADRFGIEALFKTNYDLRHMARFFEILLSIQKGKPNLLDKLLSTHPPSEERIKQAKEETEKYKQNPPFVISTPAFREIKQILEKYPNKYKKTELRQQFHAYLLRHLHEKP